MPLLAGKASKNFLKASRPPAEAPRATTGKSILVRLGNCRAWLGCMALRPVMILAFVSPGSHRGTLAGELYLITHNCSHEPFFDDISSIGYRIRYVPHLGSSLFRCAHAPGCTRLVVAYSCSSPIGGLASPREAGPLFGWPGVRCAHSAV